MKYDANYFIKKFEKIPDNKWTTGKFVDKKGRKCALGHCGRTNSGFSGRIKESSLLSSLFIDMFGFSVAQVNDNNNFKMYSHLGKTPKERILVALYNIKGMS